MRYYVLNTESNIIAGRYNGYKTSAAAKAARTRFLKMAVDAPILAIVSEESLPKRRVRNLMSGTEVDISVNTPLCCDPSSETYWSM